MIDNKSKAQSENWLLYFDIGMCAHTRAGANIRHHSRATSSCPLTYFLMFQVLAVFHAFLVQLHWNVQLYINCFESYSEGLSALEWMTLPNSVQLTISFVHDNPVLLTLTMASTCRKLIIHTYALCVRIILRIESVEWSLNYSPNSISLAGFLLMTKEARLLTC
jgi:hypothetical protein